MTITMNVNENQLKYIPNPVIYSGILNIGFNQYSLGRVIGNILAISIKYSYKFLNFLLVFNLYRVFSFLLYNKQGS